MLGFKEGHKGKEDGKLKEKVAAADHCFVRLMLLPVMKTTVETHYALLIMTIYYHVTLPGDHHKAILIPNIRHKHIAHSLIPSAMS